MTFCNDVILIKLVVNKNKNNYYYNIFLQKGSYQDKSSTKNFQMNVCISKMLYFDRTNVSEGTDVNKAIGSKECDIYHYWFFSNYSFKFQSKIFNRCHYLLMMSTSLSDIAILNIKGSDYCCISLIGKNEAINVVSNA